ncbi:MAG TPA: hypothetical protein PLL77_08480 [Pyrinomonadaceae bacterium]|nr:hypothetical protein [Pyrinomonadaceae bacterium]
MVFEAVGTVFGDLFERVAELFVGERVALSKEVAEITQDLFDRLDIAFVAVDEQLVAPRTDADVEQRFEIFNVLILNAE